MASRPSVTRFLSVTKASFFFALLPCAASAQMAIPVADGASLELTGRLHSQFRTSSVDGFGSTFFTRRARITVELAVNDFFLAKIQPEYSGGTTTLKDAYVQFDLHPAVSFRFGQLKRAFDLIDLDSSTDLSTIERDGDVEGADDCTGMGGLCNYQNFTTGLNWGERDIGARVDVDLGRLGFMGTVTNGNGTNGTDDNASKSYALRASFDVTDDVTLAGGFSTHDYQRAGETEQGVGWNVDLKLGDWRDGLHVEAGVLTGDNWRAPGSPTLFAWHVTGTYYFPIQTESARIIAWEPLLRLSQGDPDTDVDDDGGFLFTPGAMFYVAGRNKLGFNFDVYSPQSGDTEYSLKFQTFLFF